MSPEDPAATTEATQGFTPLPKLIDPEGEVKIYLTLRSRIGNIAITVFVVLFSLFMSVFTLIFMGSVAIGFNWRSFFDYKPVLTISKEGVRFRRQLYYWMEITDYHLRPPKDQEEVTKLILHLGNKKKRIKVEGLTKNPEEIKMILDRYRKLSLP